jgi:2-iminoacetate synthase ThiH
MVASDYYLSVRCKYNNFTNIIFYNFQTNDRPFFLQPKKSISSTNIIELSQTFFSHGPILKYI